MRCKLRSYVRENLVIMIHSLLKCALLICLSAGHCILSHYRPWILCVDGHSEFVIFLHIMNFTWLVLETKIIGLHNGRNSPGKKWYQRNTKAMRIRHELIDDKKEANVIMKWETYYDNNKNEQ